MSILQPHCLSSPLHKALTCSSLRNSQAKVSGLVLLTADESHCPGSQRATSEALPEPPHQSHQPLCIVAMLKYFLLKWQSDSKLYGLAFTYLNLVYTFKIYFVRQMKGYNFTGACGVEQLTTSSSKISGRDPALPSQCSLHSSTYGFLVEKWSWGTIQTEGPRGKNLRRSQECDISFPNALPTFSALPNVSIPSNWEDARGRYRWQTCLRCAHLYIHMCVIQYFPEYLKVLPFTMLEGFLKVYV